jgi:hypothetical protein
MTLNGYRKFIEESSTTTVKDDEESLSHHTVHIDDATLNSEKLEKFVQWKKHGRNIFISHILNNF